MMLPADRHSVAGSEPLPEVSARAPEMSSSRRIVVTSAPVSNWSTTLERSSEPLPVTSVTRTVMVIVVEPSTVTTSS